MNTERAKRKLSAILSADVKGYSRLMGEDEVGTVRTLKEYRELMSSLIKEYRGRVVDSPGDNVLAEFASVVDALECSIEIQKTLKSKNAALADNRKMEFRIGVNLGDVIEDEDRVYGDGVNIAARIEGLAEPGGICISGSGFEQVRNKLPLGYEYLGEHTVKNIVQPIKVYCVRMDPESAGKVIGEKGRKGRQWRWAAAAFALLVLVAWGLVWNFYWRAPKIEPASKDKMAFLLPDKPSIAVLPFVNMSEDKSQEYFSDGLTEEIINALVKLPQVFVIARNSTFTYKGKSVDVRQVGREMGVKYVLEGSVRREGERIRVTAQLVDATTGNHLFSERYDREVKDLFALQDDITMKVMTAMRVQLTEGDYARAFAKGTKSLDAYLKAMQSYQHRQVLTKEGQARARQLAEEAIALDPGYAMAYCHLAAALGNEATRGVYKNVSEVLARSMELARKAVALDDSLAQAHITLGFQYTLRRDFDRAIAQGERAVALEPNSAEIVAGLAAMLEWADRPEEAMPLFKKAMRLSPIPQPMWLLNMASAHIRMGQYEESIPICKAVLQKQPDQEFARIFLAIAYISTGREQEARAEAAEILRVNPQFSWERLARGLPRKNQDEMKRRGELLLKAGLQE